MKKDSCDKNACWQYSIFRFNILFIIAVIFFVQISFAIVFERRTRPEPELAYFIYPAAGSIPGVQSFYGAGFTVSAIGGSEVDITGIMLKGEAEHFDDGDFGINLFSILDVPVFTERLTISYIQAEIENGAWPEGERGINSDPESTYYLLGSKMHTKIAEISFNVFDNQFEIYYGLMTGDVVPYGVVDPNGTFYSAEEKKIIENPTSYRWGVYLDDTDDRRDPRVGYRIQYEKWGVPSTRGENSAFYQEDLNLTIFIPVFSDNSGVFVLNKFSGSSTVTEKGVVDKSKYVCNEILTPGCQAVLDVLYERQVAEAENGKATSLGGYNRLRGYRTNRFFDSYSEFQGIEFRWYVLETQQSFDQFIEKGVFAALQLAVFYEEGTVAPARSELWDETKTSGGLGIRAIFNTVVLRFDVGSSEEGTETTFFVGYPF